MNKTININLGGIFFHIDEIAYNKLKRYLDAISKSLNDDPQGKEEILSDIEQRMSELLSEKISHERQVINESNIDEIIAIMGQPEDYAYDSELFETPQSERKSNKKMYRDGKDKILGGVSSGLGYYFGIDAVWVRIVWILITLIYGTGVLVYIVLWIIMPEAKTTTEELEMKGEPVNIDNIEKTIKEEYSKIEEKVKNADYTKIKSGFQDFIDTMGNILMLLLKIIGKFIGIIILIIAASVLISSIIGVFSWGSIELLGFDNQIINGPFINSPLFANNSIIPNWILIIFFFMAISIPFIFLFVLGLNILSHEKKTLGKTANLSLLGIWIVSLFALAFSQIEQSNKYSTTYSVTENYEFETHTNDTLKILMHGNDILSNRKFLYRSKHLEAVEDSLGNEMLYSSYVHLDIRHSNSNKSMIKVVKSAKANNKKTSKEQAKKIAYQFNNNNNILDLSGYFLTPENTRFNNPKIDVIIYVPEGRYIYLDNSTKSFLYDVKNTQNIYDPDMVNHYYLMESSGLNCTDCEGVNPNNQVNLKINNEGVKLAIKNGKDSVGVNINSDGIEVK